MKKGNMTTPCTPTPYEQLIHRYKKLECDLATSTVNPVTVQGYLSRTLKLLNEVIALRMTITAGAHRRTLGRLTRTLHKTANQLNLILQKGIRSKNSKPNNADGT